jgi:translation elongation factor EF-1beta
VQEEDAEAQKIREQRVAEYAEKKKNKAAVVAKSMVTLDVKPWDDETNMQEIEDHVRSIQMDGLVWGTCTCVCSVIAFRGDAEAGVDVPCRCESAEQLMFWLPAAKLMPVGFGIKKLQITCVVEDDKVSVDLLEEKITEFESHVQSVDVASFNKL